MVEDTTAPLPSATTGLGDPDDKVVRELDVYLCNGELGAQASGAGRGTRRQAAAAAASLAGSATLWCAVSSG